MVMGAIPTIVSDKIFFNKSIDIFLYFSMKI